MLKHVAWFLEHCRCSESGVGEGKWREAIVERMGERSTQACGEQSVSWPLGDAHFPIPRTCHWQSGIRLAGRIQVPFNWPGDEIVRLSLAIQVGSLQSQGFLDVEEAGERETKCEDLAQGWCLGRWRGKGPWTKEGRMDSRSWRRWGEGFSTKEPALQPLWFQLAETHFGLLTSKLQGNKLCCFMLLSL